MTPDRVAARRNVIYAPHGGVDEQKQQLLEFYEAVLTEISDGTPDAKNLASAALGKLPKWTVSDTGIKPC